MCDIITINNNLYNTRVAESPLGHASGVPARTSARVPEHLLSTTQVPPGGQAKTARMKALLLPQASRRHMMGAGGEQAIWVCNPHPGLSAYLPCVLLNVSGSEMPEQSYL